MGFLMFFRKKGEFTLCYRFIFRNIRFCLIEQWGRIKNSWNWIWNFLTGKWIQFKFAMCIAELGLKFYKIRFKNLQAIKNFVSEKWPILTPHSPRGVWYYLLEGNVNAENNNGVLFSAWKYLILKFYKTCCRVYNVNIKIKYFCGPFANDTFNFLLLNVKMRSYVVITVSSFDSFRLQMDMMAG